MIFLGVWAAHIRIFEKKSNGKKRAWWKCRRWNGEEL
jgi:hypothetical protein